MSKEQDLREEIQKVLQHRGYGLSYCFKKFMNPNRSYREMDQFLLEFFYGSNKSLEQTPSTHIISGIDQIDFVAFASLINKEALNRGFQLDVKEGMIVSSSDNDAYKPQYIVYDLYNGYRLIITAAGFDFNIEKYLKDGK